MTIQGEAGINRDQVILDGKGTSRVLLFDCIGNCGTVTLKNITVQNGNASVEDQVSPAYRSGGGVWASYSIGMGSALINVNLKDNRSDSGGGIYTSGQGWTASGSSFSGNTALGGKGGAIGTDYDWLVSNCIFDNNTAVTGGAIGSTTGRVIAHNSIFRKNVATSGSGGAINTGLIVSGGSIFTENKATDGDGGAINAIVQGPVSSNLIINTSFNENSISGNSDNNSCPQLSCTAKGSAIYLKGSGSIINSIFYGHNSPSIYAMSSYNLYNNLIDSAGDIDGSNPIAIDSITPTNQSPFIDASIGNFNLSKNSLAINNGLNLRSAVFNNLAIASNIEGLTIPIITNALKTDMNGNLRQAFGTTADIGAIATNKDNASNEVSDEECLFSWAEWHYPEYFPATSETRWYAPYNYRYYADTDTYLGNNTADSHIWAILPALGFGLIDLGANNAWFAQARADNCQ